MDFLRASSKRASGENPGGSRRLNPGVTAIESGHTFPFHVQRELGWLLSSHGNPAGILNEFRGDLLAVRVEAGFHSARQALAPPR